MVGLRCPTFIFNYNNNMTRQNITESDEREVLMMQMERIEEELYIDPNEEIKHPPVSLSFGEHTMGGTVYPTPIST